MQFAPIALFVYNRPNETHRMLDSLSANSESSESIIYIYCDGPKTDASTEVLKEIEEVRTIIKNEKRFQKKIIIEASTNKGLANSIIEGVTEIVNKYGKAIILEDDLVLSPFFFVLYERFFI